MLANTRFPVTGLPSPSSEGDKGILSLFDIRFTDQRKLRGEEKPNCLTSCKLGKKKKGLEHQQFIAWNAPNTGKGAQKRS